jgi:hypothetical protein
LDCATTKYANKTVCEDKTTTCMQDYPLIACSDFANGTAHAPQSCKDFWAQF